MLVSTTGPCHTRGTRQLGADRDREGIHWPDLDEDLSIEGFLTGRKSGESQRSFKRWLEAKQAGLPVNIYEIRPAAAEDV